MKKINIILVIFVLLLSPFSSVSVKAAIEGDYKYEVNGSNVSIEKYNGPGGAVSIPDTINGMPVTVIKEEAFLNKGITDLDIPISITEIGTRAFAQNQLVDLTIPTGIKHIGIAAFQGNKLTHITFPDTLETIGQTAFGNNNLTDLKIPASVTSINHYAFEYNPLNTITFEGVPTIKADAFWKSNKEHYSFDGWYSDATFSTIWDDSTGVVTSGMTLYAKRTANPYTVTFNANGGSAVADQSILYNEKVASPATPAKPGYTFAGWYKDAAFSTAWDFDADVVTGNTTLYAKWTANTYTVKFNANGGSAVADQSIVYNGKVASPATPTQPGYAFAGWYKDAAFSTAWDFDADVVTGNTTLYAKWTANAYTVKFNANGGSAVADQRIGYNGKIASPATPTQPGYAFAGWYKDAAFSTAWDFNADVVTGNTTLYAKWSNIGGGGEGSSNYTYTLSFMTNEGTAVAAQSIAHGKKATQPVPPTKVGYTFAGWYKEAAFKNEWFFAEDTIKENTTLYAKWIAVANPPACSAEFSDISTHWAKDAIIDIACREIVNGYLDGTFKPNAPITREHVAVIFSRTFELTAIRKAMVFNDVSPSHIYYDSIMSVYEAGIFDGVSSEYFNPNAYMTRAQMAKVLVLAFGLQESTTNRTIFNDVPINHWAQGYISTLANNGIAFGDNGNFQPNEPVTRAQFVAFLHRALNL
ncbi:InlB B-repeat-containing protein [Solibacillus sp. FSL W7-1464]|uniref:InlB B-repeat-containing protein n=1 Tax=Solibacillus sp. FSL W7-1464 TaxID=2921706 RepID=UPI0030FCE602